MKFFDSIKRPSLLWLSPNDVRKVRNKIIQIFLAPDESVVLGDLRIYGGVAPCFVNDRMRMRVYLKVPKKGKPYWDLVSSDNEWNQIEFSHVTWAAEAVRKLHEHFPFQPTDNYLQNGGKFIA